MRAICVQRLWLDGKVSSAWTGYSLAKALRWIESIPRELRPRLWIEAEKKPAHNVLAWPEEAEAPPRRTSIWMVAHHVVFTKG